MLLFYLPSLIISIAAPDVIQTPIIQSSTHPHTTHNLQPSHNVQPATYNVQPTTLTQRTTFNPQPTLTQLTTFNVQRTTNLLNSHQSIHIKIIIGFKVFIINIQ